MNDPMLPLPGLSPVSGKRVEVKFDGGLLSSDGGVLALREVDQRLRVADRPERLHELRIGVQRLGLTAYAGNPSQHAGAPRAVMRGGECEQPIDAQRPPTVDPFRDVPTRDQAALAVTWLCAMIAIEG